MIVTEGSTNVTVPFYFVDDVGGTNPGEPTAGLLFSDIETGGSASYQRQGAARVDFSLVTLANAAAAHTDGGFILVNDTEMAGVYRLDIPDAAIAAGVDFVIIYLRAASANNTITRPLKIDLTTVDLREANGKVELLAATQATIDGIPTTAEFEARTIVSSSYSTLVASDIVSDGTAINTTSGVVDSVSTVNTTTNLTTNNDKTGYSVSAATASFFQDFFTVNSGEVSGNEVSGSAILEIAKVVWDRALTGATHNIATSAGRRLRGLQDFGNYLGSIHIDTVNGTAGVIVDENGTVENPVDSLADAITLNATLGYNQFELWPSSSITLAQTFSNFVFEGRDGWTLAMGGQDVSGCNFRGASISGVGTGTSETKYDRCTFNTCTLDPLHAEFCELVGPITLGKAGDYVFDNAHSRLAGSAAPIIDTGAAVANVNLAMPGYWNGIEISNLNATGTDEFSISGIGQIIYSASSSGTVNQRGDWRVTNTGGVTIVSDDNTTNLASLVTTIGVAGAGLTDITLNDASIDKFYDEVNTGVTHNIANSGGRQIREAATTGLYAGGQIWIDTVNGTSGTDVDENGTQDNPSNNIADATTIAVAKGKMRFKIAPGSSFTLTQGYTNYVFEGDDGSVIALGGQAITGCVFRRVTVTGVATGTGSITFAISHIGTDALACTLPPCHIHECSIVNDITANAAGDYVIDRCHSAIAGTATWTFDFGAAIGNTNLNMRANSGGVQLENMGDVGSDTASIEGWGQIIEGTCTSGNVSVRGNITRSFTVTDNITWDEDARIDLPGINAQADQALSDVRVDGRTLSNALEIIAAGVIGKISGAGLGTEIFVGLDNSTVRATVTVDASGNRTGVVYV